MIVILNNRLKDTEKLYIALSKIYGIGYGYSKNLCSRIGVSAVVDVQSVSVDLIKSLIKYINAECIIDRELKANKLIDIKNKIKIKSYQGRRHLAGLPVHGQNTKNNSKTAKKLLKENANLYRTI